ncbi:MAG: hypothetical protein F6K26_56620 [Moorea sp. SIO2I5]|nr:hypothetical protein [Moorena sp. SIO2I5]
MDNLEHLEVVRSKAVVFCGSEKNTSDAARSWGGSAVLGVSPMSDCRGFPHERLHQEGSGKCPLC